MRSWALVIAAVAAAAPAASADEPKPSDVAEKFNEQGRELFGKGELEAAISKFRAAIAVAPQARYFFNLCFVLNARYQLEAALGACQAVGDAPGADDRLRKRAADLIEVIEKKRASDHEPPDKPEPIKVTDDSGEPVLESKPLPPPVDEGDKKPDRVAVLRPNKRAYPPPITGRPPEAVRIVSGGPKVEAKRYHIGLIAGFSFSHVEASDNLGGTSSSDGTSGFTGGGFFATSLSRVFVGQAEIVYVQRGAGADDAIDPTGDDLTLDYLSFPVIGKIQLPLGRTKLHFDMGFSLSFLLNSSDNAIDPGTVDAGFIVGGGITFHRRGSSAWIFDLRHERGLTDVIDIAPVSLENRTWTLRLGYGF